MSNLADAVLAIQSTVATLASTQDAIKADLVTLTDSVNNLAASVSKVDLTSVSGQLSAIAADEKLILAEVTPTPVTPVA